MRYGIRSNDTVDACIRMMRIVYVMWTGGTPGPPLAMRKAVQRNIIRICFEKPFPA